jgi:hypothetical protein
MTMAVDDLLDRAAVGRRRADESSSELAALIQALDGLAGVGMLDSTAKARLTRLKPKPRRRRRAAKRAPAQVR